MASGDGINTTSTSPAVANVHITVEFTYVPVQPAPHRTARQSITKPQALSTMSLTPPLPYHSTLPFPSPSNPTNSGGLELLFDNISKHSVTLPAQTAEGSPTTVADLITWLVENQLKDPRKELFVLDGGM